MDAAFRSRGILLAYFTIGFSKVATAAVQILALPVAAHALGAERFGALLLLGAAASFLSIPAQGYSPSISYGVSHALGLQDRELLQREFWAAALLAFGLGSAAALLVLVATLTGDLAIFFVGAPVTAAELYWAGTALAAYLFLYYSFYWAEGLRAAYQEQYVTNIYSTMASVATLVAVFAARELTPTLPAFFLALFVMSPLFQAISFAFFYAKRRREFGRAGTTRSALKSAAGRAWGYSGAQAGLIVQLQGAVFLASRAFGLEAAALVGGIVRLFHIVHSFMISMVAPLTPTISRARAAGDESWLRKGVFSAMAVVVPALLVIGALIAVVGDWLMANWLGLTVGADAWLFVALGALAFTYMTAHILYLLLLALGDGGWPGRRVLYAGVAGTTAGALLLLLTNGGLYVLIGAQVVAMTSIALLPIGARLRARVYRRPV